MPVLVKKEEGVKGINGTNKEVSSLDNKSMIFRLLNEIIKRNYFDIFTD